MSKNQFKVFKSGAHFFWYDESIWFDEKRDLTWDVFLPCLEKFNAKRIPLIKTMALLLDDRMAMLAPKTINTDGLPNLTCEPRKPVPLWTMFHNGVKVTTDIIVYQYVCSMPKSLRSLNNLVIEQAFRTMSPMSLV
jgi:hypothetical protein